MGTHTRTPDLGELWRVTMEHSPVGMVVVSPEGDLLVANTRFCDMLGYEPEAITSLHARDITHPDDVEVDRLLAMDVLAGGSDSFRVTKRYVRCDGSVMVGELSLVLMRDEHAAPLYFVSQVLDLSERRAFEARLESAEQEIEVERRRVQAVFDTVAVGLLLLDGDGTSVTRNLAWVSHELRTPLTAAQACLELLEDARDLAPDVQAHLGAVRRNVLRLSHLVADLLLAATATAEAQIVDPGRVDLARVLGDAVESARSDAEGAELSLDVDLPETLLADVDGLRLRQVADKLIANAITYTPPGGRVWVALSATDDEMEIVVADSGEGIEESDLDEMFAKFVRGRNARRRLVPGTGLGLSIVRTIVEAHGGNVALESVAGVGTTVRLVLPRRGPR